ncbi:MAG: hypothetical protein ACOVS5_07645 [Oligoflexus sp.]|jgi:hypothetical protein
MIKGHIVWGCIALGTIACNGKLKTEETGGGATAAAGAEPGTVDQQPSAPVGEPVSNDLVIGLWISNCVPNPNSTIAPANMVHYSFKADGTATFRSYSYRDSDCETRYTKADVDKLRAQLQAEATAQGGPLTENELKEMDALWYPPIVDITYKMGRKYTNGLVEMDMNIKAQDGQITSSYLTIYLDKGVLYFAKVCSNVEAQFAVCGPVAGDKPENRGKKVNFDVGFEKQAS